jgi:hypothetical protein
MTGLKTLFGVTDGLRLYLGVTASPLVWICHSNHIKDQFLERSPIMDMCHHESIMDAT